MITDPIANLINNISNAVLCNKKVIQAPHSNLKEKLLELLKFEKVIIKYNIEKIGNKKYFVIYLNSNFHNFERISSPGRRIYVKSNRLPKKSSQFLTIISTSKGLMTITKAKKEHLGGEVIMEIS